MRQAFTTALHWIYNSPAIRVAGYLITAILGGILVNFIATDLRVDGEIIWSNVIKSNATLYLVIYTIVAFLWFRGLLEFERDVRKWNDPEYRRARMIRDLWPALMMANRERIEKGEAVNLAQIEKDVLG